MITSPQNSKIKQLLQLREKSRDRRRSGLFIIEGKREIEIAQNNGYHIVDLFICPDIFQYSLNSFTSPTTVTTLSKEVYFKIAYRDSTEGILAVALAKNHSLNNLIIQQDTLILIAEAPEKPGNIGALLRTADGAGVDAVIIVNPRTDLYNPNIIRSSVGGIFSQEIFTTTTEEIIPWLKQYRINTYLAAFENAIHYTQPNYKGRTAIVVGTEDIGLTNQWFDQGFQNILIPMRGSVDSLNVSVAAAVIIFEAVRQRNLTL